MSNCRFAFDLGTTSVGWAVVKIAEKQIVDLIDAGVRVFEEPVDPKSRESNAVTRRNARALRRSIRRRSTRRKLMIKTFLDFGWLSAELAAKPPYGFTSNPYKLRSEALNRSLTGLELSEVFFHLSKHRGFKSNRKSKVETENSEIILTANALEHEIQVNGHQTLGNYLYQLQLSDKHIRLRCKRTLRRMYEHEFNLIWQKQLELKNKLCSDNGHDKLSNIIFFQLPFELQKERREKTLGHCPLEPTEIRSYRWDPLFQKFRIDKTINDLELINPTDSTTRKLNVDERSKLRELLLTHKDRTFTQIKKSFGILSTHRFNFESENNDKIKGDTTRVSIEKILGKRFSSLSGDEQDQFIRELGQSEKEEEIKQICELHFNDIISTEIEDIIQKLAVIPFAEGTASYSSKALKQLMPYISKGLNEYEAIAKAYPHRDKSIELDKLGFPDKTINNPTVKRAMCQFRRVINALIDIYGKPESIIIELARDFGKTQKQRSEIESDMRKKEKLRDSWREELNSIGIPLTHENLLKLELAKQQGDVCPYSGVTLNKELLFSENGTEIDHILPYSRSLDDSRNNKIVCLTTENKNKSNKTPAEYFESNPNKLNEMLDRINQMNMPFNKKKRFYVGASAEPDECIKRQLNDTRYIARLAREYVECLFPVEDRHSGKILSSRGGLTSELRHHWGLTKNRTDLRHHALDAIVIGCTTPIILKTFQQAYRGYRRQLNFSPPFPEFKQKTESLLSKVIVSHRVSRKLSGAFHEETNYSPGVITDGNVYSSTRKPVETLEINQIEKIRDPIVKIRVIESLRSKGWDGADKTLFEKAKKEGALSNVRMPPCETMPEGVPIKKVRLTYEFGESASVFMQDKRTNHKYRRVKTGNNHALVLKKNEMGKIKAKTISVYEANSRNVGIENELIRLHKTDHVIITNPETKIASIGRVRKLSTTPTQGPYIVIDVHHFGGKISDLRKEHMDSLSWRFTNSMSLLECVKPLSISVLGKISDS